MKNGIIVLLAFLGHETLCAQQQVSSSIADVTVFTRGAQLHHTSSEQVASGKSTIVFTGLSPDLDPESVVMEVEPRSVTILSVSTRSNYLRPLADNKRIAVVRDSLAILADEIQLINDEVLTLQNEKSMLFKNEAIGGTSSGVAITEIQKAADFYRSRNNEINAAIFRLNKQLTQRRATQSAYMKQFDELNAQYNPPTSEITLELSCKENVKASFSFRYMVHKAGWAPKYDVRTNTIGDPIQLVYRANIFNNCGTDWMDVKMKLSTSDPLQGADRPVLDAWDVARMPSFAANVEVTELQAVQILADEKSGFFKSKEEAVPFTELAVQELSAEFDIPLPYTILSDSKPYTVDVREYSLPATYEHYAAPKADADAFLTARVTGWNDLNLVSGKASVYFNGTYLGQSFINTASVDDTLSISLGRDKNISMNRKKLVEVSKRQVMGNNEKETFFYETTVRNNRDKEITIVIEDQLPISSRGEIIVDALELTGGEVDKPTGKVKWRYTIAPGESKVFTLGYSIKSPKGNNYAKHKYRSVAAPSF